jgi:hypothetical protein
MLLLLLLRVRLVGAPLLSSSSAAALVRFVPRLLFVGCALLPFLKGHDASLRRSELD